MLAIYKNKCHKKLELQELMKETRACVFFPCFFPQSIVLLQKMVQFL